MTTHVVATPSATSDGPSPVADRVLAEAAMGGDERSFAALVDRYHPSLLRVARAHVGSRALAEEVVQETWIGLLGSLRHFEWRCSLRTWLFTILLRCARRTSEREGRAAPAGQPTDDQLLSDRFFPAGHRWTGAWRLDRPDLLPTGWDSVPEQELLAREAQEVVVRTASSLPEAQREVFLLRDVEGWPAPEICEALGVTPNHQRVLLHRARARVRNELEHYFATRG